MLQALRNPAVRGTLWTLGSYGLSMGLRFGSNLILTRLLIPEYFGLMALASTLGMGLELLSDLGTQQSVIQNQRGEEEDFYNTAWTVEVIRGVALWIMCLIVTLPMAHIYGDSRLKLLIPIVGLTSVFGGFSSNSIAILNRRMQLGLFTLFENISYLFSLVVMLTAVWLYPTIWTLAIAGLAGPIFETISSHFLIPGHRNRFAWNQEALDSILHFGKGIFAATALMFLADQADRFILGKLLSLELLGIYTIAFTIATLPRELLKTVSYRVLFPTASKSADRPRAEVCKTLRKQRWLILLPSASIIAFVTCYGDYAIRLLYDERYIDAAWMLPTLACGIWFSALFYTMTPTLMAIGKPVYLAHGNFARLFMVCFGLWGGYQLGGLLGAIAGIALSDGLAYLSLYYGMTKEKLLLIDQDIQATLIYVTFIGLLLLIRLSLGGGLPIDGILQSTL